MMRLSLQKSRLYLTLSKGQLLPLRSQPMLAFFMQLSLGLLILFMKVNISFGYLLFGFLCLRWY